jgi:hypothetical protein
MSLEDVYYVVKVTTFVRNLFERCFLWLSFRKAISKPRLAISLHLNWVVISHFIFVKADQVHKSCLMMFLLSFSVESTEGHPPSHSVLNFFLNAFVTCKFIDFVRSSSFLGYRDLSLLICFFFLFLFWIFQKESYYPREWNPAIHFFHYLLISLWSPHSSWKMSMILLRTVEHLSVLDEGTCVFQLFVGSPVFQAECRSCSDSSFSVESFYC